jgi:tight adherence protein B
MLTSNLAAVILAAIAAGGLAYVFIYPLLSGEARADKRQQALVTGGGRERRAERAAAANRRDQVAQSLKELESKQKAGPKLTLDSMISQAGLDWSKQKFFVVSAITGVLTAIAVLFFSGSFLPAGGALFVGTFGLPRWFLGRMRKRRIARFIEELPNAMDVIVRGIRSGLPLNDCLRIVANEAQEPVKTEFRQVVEAQTLGMTVPEAVGKLYERVPIPEANFFAIVIAIQSKAGGNLSEALANLSRVLRERKKMKGKIQAMSTEAKSSAGIIAALPFAVALLVYLSSPGYIQLLWTTQAGMMTLFGCGLWMSIGIFVMKQMINFDF